MKRREFLRNMALGTAGCAFGARAELTFPQLLKIRQPRELKASEKLNIGVIGVGGKGWSDWTPMLDHGENIVALCDVDRGTLDRGLKHLQGKGVNPSSVQTFTDYRRMLDQVKNLDAVIVATPDHTHGPAAIRAMKRGCHVYVQKPLVRTIWEANYFGKVAKEMGVVTQMGNQGSAINGFRRSVEVLQSGILGNVTEVHVWTDRAANFWPQGIPRPAGSDPVPAALDWDSWLGTAPFRPFKNGAYHTFRWRGYYDFGTGAFGDMACHNMNLPIRGLSLGAVESAECISVEGVSPDHDTYPLKTVVRVHYAARTGMVPVDFYWYDGKTRPDIGRLPPQVAATFGSNLPFGGLSIIGDKGSLYSYNDRGEEAYICLKDEAKYKAVQNHEACKDIPETLPRYGLKGNIYAFQDIEFVNACKGEGKAYSDIDHSVPMVEGISVACVAQRLAGRKLNWDAEKKTFGNAEADSFIRPHIRSGWEF